MRRLNGGNQHTYQRNTEAAKIKTVVKCGNLYFKERKKFGQDAVKKYPTCERFSAQVRDHTGG